LRLIASRQDHAIAATPGIGELAASEVRERTISRRDLVTIVFSLVGRDSIPKPVLEVKLLSVFLAKGNPTLLATHHPLGDTVGIGAASLATLRTVATPTITIYVKVGRFILRGLHRQTVYYSPGHKSSHNLNGYGTHHFRRCRLRTIRLLR
jgi:hypothetical protein